MKPTLYERILDIESAPADRKNEMLKKLRVELTLIQGAMTMIPGHYPPDSSDAVQKSLNNSRKALDHIKAIAEEGVLRDMGISVTTKKFKP